MVNRRVIYKFLGYLWQKKEWIVIRSAMYLIRILLLPLPAKVVENNGTYLTLVVWLFALRRPKLEWRASPPPHRFRSQLHTRLTCWRNCTFRGLPYMMSAKFLIFLPFPFGKWWVVMVYMYPVWLQVRPSTQLFINFTWYSVRQKKRFPGCENFFLAVAYHFWLALPEKFSQPGNHSFAGLCINVSGSATGFPTGNGEKTKQQPCRAMSGHQLSCCLISLCFL